MIGEYLNNRYKVKTKLGKGAMGTVYSAIDSATGLEVALKIISSELALEQSMLERFKREGESLQKLKHPNIVGFLDSFQHNEQYVIVMEYVSGGSLHDRLQSGMMPLEEARRFALSLCDALIRSHSLNIVHRDIKPENILITEDGVPKLADFGVARLNEGTRMTRTGTQVGTPYYMAPEAWAGNSDAQSDIWSLGVVLFEMLTGVVPFTGETPLVLMSKINTASIPDLKKIRGDIPKGTAQIVKRMLTRDRNKRYQTMREVSVDLERGILTRPIVQPRIWHWALAVVLFGFLTISISALRDSLSQPLVKPIPTHTLTGTVLAEVTPETQVPTISPTEVLGVGSTRLSEIDGMAMVFVPEGEFIMGSDTGEKDERPAHKVYLDGFWIDATVVTNAMYAKCVTQGVCKAPQGKNSYTRTAYFGEPQFDNYPVVFVDWNMANDYCNWVGRRLPTEAEWEKAARGPDGYTYPWGDEKPNIFIANYDGSIGDTTDVFRYPDGASLYGALDMAGNVVQWVSSLYFSYPYDKNDGREDLTSSGFRVIKGSGWNSGNNGTRSSNRSRIDPTWGLDNGSFRCATTK